MDRHGSERGVNFTIDGFNFVAIGGGVSLLRLKKTPTIFGRFST